VTRGRVLRILLATAADVDQGRGDSTHILALYKYLRGIAEVSLLHRGKIGTVAGRMESGTEARSIGNLFKMVTYHAVLAVWVIAIANRDTVVYCRDWSVALVAGLLKTTRGFRVIYEANSLVSVEMRLTVGRNLSRPFGILQEFAFVAADAIVAVTSRLAESIRASLDGRKPTILVIPNAGDSEFEPLPKKVARMRLGLGEELPIVGFVGNLGPWQGLGLLIRAFAILRSQLPPAELVIVGDGPERTRLEAMVKQIGLASNVRFVGSVPHTIALEYVCAFDVGTIPYESSLLYDAIGRSPIKAYEYMACNCPIVAGSYPELAEDIVRARCGLIVPPNDSVAFAREIVSLLEDKERASEIGRAGREYVVSHRSWSRAASQIIGLCNDLVGESSE